MSLRVLIVEDEPLIALDLQTILEDEGHIIVGIAPEMREALKIADTRPPLDLAIMDVDLARQPDGVEVARRLREEYGVTSLFVSARLTDEVRARALEWDPIGFVGKPFSRAGILRAIAGITERSTSS